MIYSYTQMPTTSDAHGATAIGIWTAGAKRRRGRR